MAERERIPAFMAYLPAKVRYDTELAPNAKLLYAEVTALAESSGYCYAKNEYFARLFDLAIKSVSRLISQLAEKGYVVVDVIRDPETNIVVERRIWVDIPLRKSADTSPQNCGDPPPKKEGNPPRKIAEENDYSSFNDIPPISPTRDKPLRGGMPVDIKKTIEEYSRGLPGLYQSLEALMEVRAKRRAVNSMAAVKLLLKKLDSLAGDNDALRQQLVETAVENGWKSVFPLKGAQPGPLGTEQGGATKEVRLPEW